MSTTRAAILVEPAANIGQNNRIECMFNPTEFTLSQGSTWTKRDVQGKGTPEKRFASSTGGSFDLKLMFDTTTVGSSVRDHTDLLLLLTEPHPSLPTAAATAKRPPFVWFSWGRWTSFKAVVAKVSLTFTYFAADGSPLRAHASVSCTQPEEDEAWGPQNPTSGTPSPHRLHRVQPGESLDRIAWTYYADSTDWRQIADCNGLSDPARLRAGQVLAIPERLSTNER